MDEVSRVVDALENIAIELERLRVLKGHELGVRLEHNADGEPYVPQREEQPPAQPGRGSYVDD